VSKTPAPAVSVAIVDGDRFLLVRRGRPPAFGLYAFPGGRVEAGETLHEAVVREALEETGALLTDVRHLVDLEIGAEDGPARVEFILSVHAAAFAGGTVEAADDAAEAVWVTVDEMAALPLAGSVLDIARQLAGR
jgi:8-oxo-dGTP diphosphatase